MPGSNKQLIELLDTLSKIINAVSRKYSRLSTEIRGIECRSVLKIFDELAAIGRRISYLESKLKGIEERIKNYREIIREYHSAVKKVSSLLTNLIIGVTGAIVLVSVYMLVVLEEFVQAITYTANTLGLAYAIIMVVLVLSYIAIRIYLSRKYAIADVTDNIKVLEDEKKEISKELGRLRKQYANKEAELSLREYSFCKCYTEYTWFKEKISNIVKTIMEMQEASRRANYAKLYDLVSAIDTIVNELDGKRICDNQFTRDTYLIELRKTRAYDQYMDILRKLLKALMSEERRYAEDFYRDIAYRSLVKAREEVGEPSVYVDIVERTYKVPLIESITEYIIRA